MIPAVYSLFRDLPKHRARCWRGETLAGMAAAPIYVFPDQERFDSDEVQPLAADVIAAPLRLPHATVIFELTDRGPLFRTQVVYARQAGDEVEAVFLGQEADSPRWSDICAHARFTADGCADVETNPKIGEDGWRQYAEVVSALVWRGLGILKHAGTTAERSVPRTRRPKLARAGVRGWTWRQVEIVPERLVSRSAPQGGTHASPRWHIRRGHWRQLADGRRVFVRACQVGDPGRGGVLKDYTVGERAA